MRMTAKIKIGATCATFVLGAGAALAQGAPGSSTPDGSPALKSASPRNDVPDEAYGAKARKRTKGKASLRAATTAEVIAGSRVSDSKGEPVGTIESVEADGAIVATGAGRVKVPVEAFGTNGSGLLLSVTKAEFDALVSGAAGPAG